jgi:hypothetical protein
MQHRRMLLVPLVVTIAAGVASLVAACGPRDADAEEGSAVEPCAVAGGDINDQAWPSMPGGGVPFGPPPPPGWVDSRPPEPPAPPPIWPSLSWFRGLR